MATTLPPQPLRAWAQSIPAVRCVAPAFRVWTGAADSPHFRVSPTARLADAGSFATVLGLTRVGTGADSFQYLLGTVPSTHALVMHAGSEPDETDFTAVFAQAPATPTTVAQLPAAPKTREGLGLGSTRAAVEAQLGRSTSTAACGLSVVRYEQSGPGPSILEEWFVYRGGIVVALARYEAV